MSRKAKVKPVDGVQLTNQEGETVLLFKVRAPLNEQEHEMLANKVRTEQERSGIKIILVPFSVEAEVSELKAESNPPDNPDQTPASDEGSKKEVEAKPDNVQEGGAAVSGDGNA